MKGKYNISKPMSAPKAVFQGAFIVLNIYIRNEIGLSSIIEVCISIN